MIQPLFEHRQTLAGYETRVLELEGDGIPIVLFHGYADSADTWRQMLATLAREGRRAIAFDLPGFGAAHRLAPDPVLPQLDAFAVAAARYATGGRRAPVVAVGNSLGGCLVVATRRAGARADRGGRRDRPGRPRDDSAAVSRATRSGPALAAGTADACARHRPAGRRRAALSAARICRPRRDRPPRRRPRSRGITARARGSRTTSTSPTVWYRSCDRRSISIGSPRLCCSCGETATGWCSTAARNGCSTPSPASRLELLAGVGHCPQVEAPVRVCELLLEFWWRR